MSKQSWHHTSAPLCAPTLPARAEAASNLDSPNVRRKVLTARRLCAALNRWTSSTFGPSKAQSRNGPVAPTRKPTLSFERFSVVRVPFPFTDRITTKNRPALVLSDAAAFNTPAGHSVMAMITSASNAPWPLDCPLNDLATAGLPAPFTQVWPNCWMRPCETAGCRLAFRPACRAKAQPTVVAFHVDWLIIKSRNGVAGEARR